jgi:hypothetical protein
MELDKSASHAGEGSMVTGAEGELAKEAAKVLIEHVVPKITDYGRMLWSGRRFLILGPPRCGKTSFLNFLEYLILEPEKTTPPTVIVDKREDVVLKLGPQGNLILRVRKPRDVPGREPIHQMQYIKEYLPHCIVIVLDATKFAGVPDQESSLVWLSQFCAHLNILITSNKKVAKKLKAMTVVLNKWDKVPAQDEADDKANREIYDWYVREALDNNLKNTFYIKGGPNPIDIVPCVLVRSRLGDAPARELVQSIALALSRR